MGWFSTPTGQQAIGQGITSVLGLGTSVVNTQQQRDLLKQQAQIQADKAKSDIALAQLQLDAVRAQQAGATATKQGGNTMLYVGLGIGAVVILGVVIFAVTRKKA